MNWKTFDVVNKSLPSKPGMYLWYTDGRVGLFMLMDKKPRFAPYDMRYYVGQNKLAYVIFANDNSPKRDETNNFKIEKWTEAGL